MLVAALVASSLARAAHGEEPPEPRHDDHEPGRESWTVPALHGLGVLTGMRIGAAVLWPDPFAETDPEILGRRWGEAFTEPPLWDSSQAFFEWDRSQWWLNAIAHPVFGSELYLRARTCRHDVLPALLFTAAGSTLWEYGFEGNAVRPSALDLAFTPVAGLALGEARFAVWRWGKRLGDPGWRGVVTSLVDPFGELERALGTPC
jgi:hypothetical protein